MNPIFALLILSIPSKTSTNLILFPIVSLFTLTIQECFDNLKPFQYSSDSVCSNPTNVLKKTWPDFPSKRTFQLTSTPQISSFLVKTGSSKILTLDLQFQIINICATSPPPYTLFGLQTSGAAQPLAHFQYDDSSSPDYSFTINTGSGSYAQSGLFSTAIQQGDFFEVLVSINTDTNQNFAVFTFPGGNFAKTMPAGASFSGFQFDDTTKFVFCGDPATLDVHFYCKILNLQTWYTTQTDLRTPFLPGDLYPILKAYYPTDENKDFTLVDTIGGIGDLTLGDANGNFAPLWYNSALVFVAGTEFITLPSFIPSEAYRTFSNSFTISFWIKVGDGPNSGVLFNRLSTNSGVDLLQISLELDGTITAAVTDNNAQNRFYIQSSESLPINTWTLLTVTFLTDSSQVFAIFTIYFGNVQQNWMIASTDAIIFDLSDLVQIGGNLALNKPLFIARISIYSPGSNYIGDLSSCSNPLKSCEVAIGAFNIDNCLFGSSKCDSTCLTCSGPMPETCLTCSSDRYFDDGYCVSNCFTYSDGSCLSTCSSPYTPIFQTHTFYCNFKCSTTTYYYPNGSCLTTCPKPAKRSSPRPGENLCKAPCDNTDYFYYPDLNTCAASCSSNYLQDSSSTFYKQCILAPVSTTTKNVIKTTEKAGTAAKTVTQVTTALSSGSPLGVSAAVAGKIFSNIKYLNITYSVELQSALLTWKSTFISLDFLPDMPLTLENKIASHPVPYMFEKYDVVSSFLINFWENILFLLILTLLYLVTRLFECALSKFSTPKVLRVMVQNFIFTQLYSFYGDILFYSTIEYRSLDMSEGISGLSFFASCILLIIMFLSFLSHFRLLKKYQQIKEQAQNSHDMSSLDKFIESKSGLNVLFRDFKDNSLIYQSFLLLLTARDLAFSLILTTLFNHPLAQTIIILILNVAMFGYLLLRPPLTSKFDGAQQLYYEFITLSVNVSVLILAILDAIGSVGVDLRTSIGRFVIAINMCFNFGALLFMLVGLGMLLKEIYQEYKAKSQAKKSAKLPDVRHTRPISSHPEAGEQMEVKDLSLDESHQQLVNTSMVAHNVSPVRIKGLGNESELEKSPIRNSPNANFPLIQINGTPQNFSSQKKKYEPEPEPKGELESLTLNNVQSNEELLLNQTPVRSPSIDISQEIKLIQEENKKGVIIESFGDVSQGVEREKTVVKKDLGNQETTKKRIRRGSTETEK